MFWWGFKFDAHQICIFSTEPFNLRIDHHLMFIKICLSWFSILFQSKGKLSFIYNKNFNTFHIISLFLFYPAGHLTFQCFSTEGASAIIDEVESTTSDSEAEMQQLEAELKEKRKQEEGDFYNKYTMIIIFLFYNLILYENIINSINIKN